MYNLGQTAIGMPGEALTSVYEIVCHCLSPCLCQVGIHSAHMAGFQAYHEVLDNQLGIYPWVMYNEDVRGSVWRCPGVIATGMVVLILNEGCPCVPGASKESGTITTTGRPHWVGDPISPCRNPLEHIPQLLLVLQFDKREEMDGNKQDNHIPYQHQAQ